MRWLKWVALAVAFLIFLFVNIYGLFEALDYLRNKSQSHPHSHHHHRHKSTSRRPWTEPTTSESSSSSSTTTASSTSTPSTSTPSTSTYTTQHRSHSHHHRLTTEATTQSYETYDYDTTSDVPLEPNTLASTTTKRIHITTNKIRPQITTSTARIEVSAATVTHSHHVRPHNEHYEMRRLDVVLLSILVVLVGARYEDKYDHSKLPWDLRPVQNLVGLWTMTSMNGRARDLPPPDQLDYSINPIPKFGARALNVTHTFFKNGDVLRHDYGFMPVKNATRRDTRIHVAYLTTSSEGWSMMEQGQVKGSELTFHLKQFLRRSFDVGTNNLEIREFERQIEQTDYNSLTMRVRAETAFGTEAYTAYYRRVMG